MSIYTLLPIAQECLELVSVLELVSMHKRLAHVQNVKPH